MLCCNFTESALFENMIDTSKIWKLRADWYITFRRNFADTEFSGGQYLNFAGIKFLM